jgi:lipopolysaccharide export system protein LptC
MTDYFYQAKRRRGLPDTAGDTDSADAGRRHSPYPPEDEAYWAESGAAEEAAGDGPLWYEDRVRPVEDTTAEPEADAANGASALPPAGLPVAYRWSEPDEADIDAVDADPEARADEMAAWADAEATEEGSWQEPWPDGDGDPDVAEAEWKEIEGEPAAAPRRAYVPGAATAAAAVAAAASGERKIRFDPTKERGAAYYDHAARHTRRVRLLKIALPTVAVLSVAGFFAVMSLNKMVDGLPALNLSGINIEQRQITMDKPHISGFDGTKRAYEINAVTATQELGKPKVMTFQTIQARFGLGDDVRANLHALTGVYDDNTKKLNLSGGIDLTTTNGYTARLEVADVDVDKGTVKSDTSVRISGKEGWITADSIEVLDRGKHVFFRGNVKVQFQPPESADDKSDDRPVDATAQTPPAVVPADATAAPDGST